MRNKETINTISKVLIIIFIAAFILYNIALGCPVRNLLGFPCPACGLTRATAAALRGDFALAFSCHPLFPLAYICLLLFILYLFLSAKHKLTKKRDKLFAVIFICILIAFLAVYFIRIFTGTLV